LAEVTNIKAQYPDQQPKRIMMLLVEEFLFKKVIIYCDTRACEKSIYMKILEGLEIHYLED